MSDRSLHSKRTLWRFIWLGLAALGVLTSIGVAAAVVGSSPAGAAVWHAVSEHRRGLADRGERFARHAEFATEWLLREVDASEEQQLQIQQIVEQETAALQALGGEPGQHHEAWVALFSGETIDRSAVEALRSEHLELANEVSTRLAEALVDVAEVLTPEQRQELLEMAAEHRERRSFRRHRWH